MSLYIAGVIVLVFIIAINIYARGLDRDGGWHDTLFFEMRRYNQQGWEYRPMTDEEILDFQRRWGW